MSFLSIAVTKLLRVAWCKIGIDESNTLVCRHTMKGLEKAREEMDSGSSITITSASLGDISKRAISTASDNLVNNGVWTLLS